MRILITGRNGFIGQPLAARLKKDHTVISLIRRTQSSIDYTGEELLIADLRDITLPGIQKHRVDLIVHLAVLMRGARGTVEQSNVESARRIFDVARRLDVPVLFLSSLNVLFYEQLGAYARSKKTAEDILKEYCSRYAIVRPAFVMGPGSPSLQMVARVQKRFGFVPLLGQGLGKTQPVSVSTLVDRIVALVDKNQFEGQTLQVVGQEIMTYRGILEQMFKPNPVRFIHLPYGLSLFVVQLLEKLRIPLPLSSEEIRSVNMDKLVPLRN